MTILVEFALPQGALLVGAAVPDGAAVTLAFEPVVPVQPARGYLCVRGPDHESAVAALTDVTGTAVEVSEHRAEETRLSVDWRDVDDDFLEQVRASDGTLLTATCADHEWVVTFRFPDTDSASAFYEACTAASVPISVRDIRDRETRVTDELASLSAVQRETLRAALEAGYFEVLRQVTIADLAADLDVSQQAVSERLRRGLSSLIDSTVRDADSQD